MMKTKSIGIVSTLEQRALYKLTSSSFGFKVLII